MGIRKVMAAIMIAAAVALAASAVSAEPKGDKKPADKKTEGGGAATQAAQGAGYARTDYGVKEKAEIIKDAKEKYVCMQNNMYMSEAEETGALCNDGVKVIDFVTRMIDNGWPRKDITDFMSMIKMGQPLVQKTGQQACVKKGDKLKLDLFIMSRCPYGVRFVTDTLVPMLDDIGSSVDFTPYYIVGEDQQGNLVSMHGQAEMDEDYRQICIREKYNTDKWVKYFKCYASEIYSNRDNPKDWKYCATQAEIDPQKIESCFASESKVLIKKDMDLSQKYEAGGSPSAVYNCDSMIVGAIPYKSIKSNLCRLAPEPKPANCSKP